MLSRLNYNVFSETNAAMHNTMIYVRNKITSNQSFLLILRRGITLNCIFVLKFEHP